MNHVQQELSADLVLPSYNDWRGVLLPANAAKLWQIWAGLFTQSVVHQCQIYLMTTGESTKHLRILLWAKACFCHPLPQAELAFSLL